MNTFKLTNFGMTYVYCTRSQDEPPGRDLSSYDLPFVQPNALLSGSNLV